MVKRSKEEVASCPSIPQTGQLSFNVLVKLSLLVPH